MAKVGRLVNSRSGEVVLTQVKWCSGFLCKLRGLQFRAHLEPGEGLLMVEPFASRTGPSIHMFFMRFPIAAIWMDASLTVVDKVLAKPWRPVYAPSKAARYTLETDPDLLERVHIGDTLSFEPDHA